MEQVEKISVTVTAAMARDIKEKVEAGSYASASEVIRAALRALQREDQEHSERMESIRARVRQSLDERNVTFTNEQVFDELRSTLKARAAGGFHETPQSPLE
jgi:antitoxin ParD1/3/4